MACRRVAAEALLEKAEQLIRLPQMVMHGYGQAAGVGLAAIRTASGDEAKQKCSAIFKYG